MLSAISQKAHYAHTVVQIPLDTHKAVRLGYLHVVFLGCITRLMLIHVFFFFGTCYGLMHIFHLFVEAGSFCCFIAYTPISHCLEA